MAVVIFLRSLLVSSVDVISRENRAYKEEEEGKKKKKKEEELENYDVTILVYQSSMLHGQHLKRSMQEGVLWAFV